MLEMGLDHLGRIRGRREPGMNAGGRDLLARIGRKRGRCARREKCSDGEMAGTLHVPLPSWNARTGRSGRIFFASTQSAAAQFVPNNPFPGAKPLARGTESNYDVRRRKAEGAMIRKARFLAFRRKYSDPILSGLTFVLVVLLFVLVPLQAEAGASFLPLGVAVILVMIAGVFVLSGNWLVLAPIGAAIVMEVVVARRREYGAGPHPHIYLIGSLWLTLSLTFVIVVARAVFARGLITMHRVVGGVLIYLLLAMIFVSLYLFVGEALPGAFQNLDIADSPHLAADVIYFSFVTLTSVGYGDIVPIHPIARSLCNLESICGQLFPAILIAGLVSRHIEDRK
jgi:hypothetical protein